VSGAHDLGGAPGFGPVRPEPDEPPFHAPWERRVLALTLAMGATQEWSIDQSRAARESLPAAEYLARTYYEVWLAGLERLVRARGLTSARELAEGRALDPPRPVARVLHAEDVAAALARGAPTLRPAVRAARFAVGDRVRAIGTPAVIHTRLPRYASGRRGTIELVHGCHVFPDRNALGLGEDPQWLYGVRFDARELWGGDADPTVTVSIDAFEPYLEPGGE
jgi:nitrile hydratase beta subunit